MGVEQSGSNEFYSDENLMKRAVPADYTDFARLPGESLNDAVAGSPALANYIAQGGVDVPLQLAEIEVDEGGRSADYSHDAFDEPAYTTTAPQHSADTARIDGLEAKLDKLLNILGGQ